MKYAGRWHTEGQTEHIVAVGVYYVDVDEQLEGGFLKFRPPTAPQPHYDFEMDYEVDSIYSGAAVVFHNSMPHRFRQIRNLTNENRRRTFLNFFIVDPLKPIPMSLRRVGMAPVDLILQILLECSRRLLGNSRQLDDLAVKKIISFLPEIWETIEEAKEFRERVRKSMIEDKQGWGHICWGNCGTVEFVKSITTLEPRKRSELYDILQHTESE
ncbi:unnamed protein product [Didymodactylos carnosus]|uniref:Uncharacterized protein n=1 Tax=Didymodactylos carnosus TaxID=1234261 RepID=A0A815UBZ3_9BILA|nr:unnamed protein product [Didymodactylos carnosus]CAF1569441.1 unnamed protein product [Didymodactylos carnosus]CAF4363378.1 unnamed protein product [Didymodactylos carnosus]CAF4377218.1 unnamed protein product [Didymodactylos carnosus]